MKNLTLDDLDLSTRRTKMTAAYQSAFGGAPEIGVRAPGRVDLMGSHTDYNEGCVLTLSIDRDTWILGSPRDDGQVELLSLNLDSKCQFAIDGKESTEGWGLYVEAVVRQARSANLPVTGFQGVAHGTVPIGSGLSSSASLEAAVATLLEQLGGFTLEKLEKAKLCQRAENEGVGVNCGILDQYSSILGEAGKALLLDCRSLTHTTAPVSPNLQPVICNTCAPRQLSGSEYGERRQQCETAAKYFSDVASASVTLRDVSIAHFEEHKQDLPPVVQKRSRFIIEEQARVGELATALEVDDRQAIHRIMAASFAGAHDLFEISVPEMQAMFDAMSAAPGVVGCRQAGAGFGGCMIALVEQPKTAEFQESVRTAYQQATSIRPEISPVCTAPGAGTL